MCKPAENHNNCFTCERRNETLEADNGTCQQCINDDKVKGPFSRFQRRKA